MRDKKAAIVADDYKVKTFKKELAAAGFTEVECLPFGKDCTTISIKYSADEYEKLRKLIIKTDFALKNRN